MFPFIKKTLSGLVKKIKNRIAEQTQNGKSNVQKLMEDLSALYSNSQVPITRAQVLSSL
jgi:uncharacterized protein YpuA (DUF1002 family)